MKNMLLFSLLVLSVNDASAMLANHGKRVAKCSVGSLGALLSARSSGASIHSRRYVTGDVGNVNAWVQELKTERKELQAEVERTTTLENASAYRGIVKSTLSFGGAVGSTLLAEGWIDVGALSSHSDELLGATAALFLCGVFDMANMYRYTFARGASTTRIGEIDRLLARLQGRVHEAEEK